MWSLVIHLFKGQETSAQLCSHLRKSVFISKGHVKTSDKGTPCQIDILFQIPVLSSFPPERMIPSRKEEGKHQLCRVTCWKVKTHSSKEGKFANTRQIQSVSIAFHKSLAHLIFLSTEFWVTLMTATNHGISYNKAIISYNKNFN